MMLIHLNKSVVFRLWILIIQETEPSPRPHVLQKETVQVFWTETKKNRHRPQTH